MGHVQKKPTKTGKLRWQARWTGPDGVERAKTFDRKGDADAHLKTVDRGQGGSPTMSVLDLADEHYAFFAKLVESGQREQVSLDGYGTARDVHVRADALFARTKLCDLTAPKVQRFLDDLALSAGPSVARKVRKSLVRWNKFGIRRGWLTLDVTGALQVEDTARPDVDDEGVCRIPPKKDLAALMKAAHEGPSPERDAAVVHVLMFGGVRASELLGLADEHVPLGATTGEVKVRERLERRYNRLGKVKSAKARRTVKIAARTVRAVKAWRLKRGPARPFMHDGQRTPGRLFPNPDGGPVWGYQDFLRDCWRPLMQRAGLLEMLPDAKGKLRPVTAFAPHTLRHVFASNHIANGVKPKKLQEMLGHSTLKLTMDTYGHLWKDEGEDDAIAEAAERLLAEG